MGNLLNIGRGVLEHKINWANEYLTFEALESGTFTFTSAAEYSLNKGAWTSLSANTATPTLSQGDTIRWRASITPSSSAGVGTFSSTGQYNAMGNPLSLRSGDSFVGVTTMPNNTYMFYMLFKNSTGLVNANNIALVCTTIRSSCYRQMFYGCTALETPPSMSATSSATYCYNNMFSNCTSLTSVPTVSIAVNTESCCNAMFYGCTSITNVSNITLTGSAAYASCGSMFKGCTSLTTAMASLPSSVSASQSFHSMFSGCTLLVTPPALPATSIRESTYSNTFLNCTSLVTAPQMAVTTFSGNTAMQDMFKGCTSLVNAPSLPATTLGNNCYNGMFSGCTSLEKAPELPAPTLTAGCYSSMFTGCSKLKYIKCLATNISASSSRYNWVNGVASSGTFVKDANMSDWPSGASGIPNNWTVQDYVES